MRIETLEDIIHACRNQHQMLSDTLKQFTQESGSERARLLFDYLSSHEQHIAQLLRRIEETAEPKALHTWVYEYLTQQAEMSQLPTDAFAGKSADDIVSMIFTFHKQASDFYQELKTQDDALSIRDVLDQLIDLEQHEAMQMAQSLNRFHDM